MVAAGLAVSVSQQRQPEKHGAHGESERLSRLRAAKGAPARPLAGGVTAALVGGVHGGTTAAVAVGVGVAVAVAAAAAERVRDELRQADEDEGPGSDQEEVGDHRRRDEVAQAEGQHHPEDGEEGGEEVVEQRLVWDNGGDRSAGRYFSGN